MKRMVFGFWLILGVGPVLGQGQVPPSLPNDVSGKVFEHTFVIKASFKEDGPVDSLPADNLRKEEGPALTTADLAVKNEESCPGLSEDLCGDCKTAGPRIWGGFDYMMWWVRKGRTPPLVVTGSPTDPFPGALDQPGTKVLFGDQGLDYGMFNGLRLNLGLWLDSNSTFGVEAGGFVLERRSVHYSARGDANGQPYLATPFVNANTGNDNVYFISQNFADPNLTALLTGGVAVVSSTQLWSWEINGAANLIRNDNWNVDILGGFRQVSLRESLSYVTSVTNLAPGGASKFLLNPVDPPFTVTTFDGFQTKNLFNGGQIGARIDRHWGPLTFEVVGKLAMGSMHEVVNIQGQTTTNAPLPVTQAAGGIYAQNSNIGNYSRDAFAVIPEVGLEPGFVTHQKPLARALVTRFST